MFRSLVIAAVVLATFAGDLFAKEWAQKMFKITKHDFGHVARGAKTEFAFELTNLYEEEVHIQDVRTSCGCTTPSITKNTLKTWEKGAVVATFNTSSFTGQRGATLTVVIDRPFFAEVQLNVSGYIHGDVDFQPGAVSFGDLEQGVGATREVMVTRHGVQNWNISDVRSANQNLEVELSSAIRQNDRVSYKMTVRLKPDTPAGSLQDTLTLVTDDARLPTVPVTVEGKVVSPLSVSPASLFVGVLEPGQTVKKQLVIRAKKPFKITSIKADGGEFEFQPSAEAKLIHLVPVVFKANEAGEFDHKIQIETDLAVGGAAVCQARGTVNDAETGQKQEEVASLKAKQGTTTP